MTKIAKKLIESVKSEPVAANLLAAVAAAVPTAKRRRGRTSKFESVPNIKEALEILAKNGHNFQTAAEVLKKQPGLEFVNAPNLRFTAIKMGIPFASIRGPRKPKAEKIVKAEPAPVHEEPVALVAHKPRGRRSKALTEAIAKLTSLGFKVA